MQVFIKKHGLAALLWAVLIIATIMAMPNVSQLVRDKGAVTLPASVQSEVAQTIDRKSVHNQSVRSLIVVFNKQQGHLTVQDQKRINHSIHQIKSDSNLDILSMTSASDNAAAKQQLSSKDQTTQLAMISLSSRKQVHQQAQQLRQYLKISGLRTYVTGSALLNDDFSTTTQAGLKKTEIIAAVFIFIVLILVFRSILIPIISLLTVGIAYLVSASLVMNLAQHFNFPISNFTQIFMVVVLFGIGTDYNILLYNRFKEELAAGLSVDESTRIARNRAGRTILYSGSSVFIGFAVLALAKFSFYQSAVGVAIGILVLLAVLLTLNPFFMATLGQRMFWPSQNIATHGTNRIWRSLAKFAMNHTIMTVIATLVIFTPLLLFSQQKLNFNSADELPNTIESKAGYNLIQKHYPAGMSGPSTLYIDAKHSLNNQQDLGTVDDLTNYLKAEPGVKQVSSVTQPGGHKIKQLYLKQQLGQLVTGLNQANKGLSQVEAGLSKANTQLASANNTQSTTQLNQLTTGTSQLQSGAKKLSQGISTYTAGVTQVANGTHQLASGTSSLGQSVGQLTTGSQQLTNGLSQFQTQTKQISALATGTSQLTNSSAMLSNGLGQLSSAISPFSSSLSKLNSGTQRLASQSTQLVSGAQSVATGSAQVNTGVKQLQSKIVAMQAQVKQLRSGLSSANQALVKIGAGTTSIKQYLAALQTSYVGNQFYIPQQTLNSSTFKPSLDAFMADNHRITKITIVLNSDPSTTKSAHRLQTITSDVHAKLKHSSLSHATVAIGGQTSQTADLESLSNTDFNRTAIIMLIGIGLALILVTRSLIQPLAIIGTLMVTYISALTVTRFLSSWLLGQALLTWNTPFFSFIMLIALGVDYSIFLMMRYRDDAAKIPDVRKRIINASAIIGTVVLSAALILGGTFAALMPSGVLTLIQVALTVIVGLIILVILLPITMSIMVKWTYPYVHDKFYEQQSSKSDHE
ncbi:RND superfamily resistance-nodulation-cell division proton (H+) antiporter [Secundilactobacillus odoratitofui DSM 19909 = JCM 15043]|uniref:RND superfamily resistance-nodulation-cell division proton (H+) antiporter n=1 Tax=Secundilactobacillus odoratitofui DSM 19909 = JCM 15043 TaxID=1423776 RepID=A0A0R1LN91_9LACO|nr:MMPL family transporter [Secundilactobacillus odoratitofui]KRK97350.1 RND superfamily resistance-nodulation-cell division proton (H+) antiporter [Secundilactobacillus odoratitofui DSM 19909 = JCM 15043]